MAKVEYTFKMEEYFCTTLDYIRKMHETRDYSGLMAIVERLQIHGNSMESALWNYRDTKSKIQEWANDKEISDKEFREKVLAEVKSE